jgi:hypothetical protein
MTVWLAMGVYGLVSIAGTAFCLALLSIQKSRWVSTSASPGQLKPQIVLAEKRLVR